MDIHEQPSWVAFAETRCIASGTPREVASKVKSFVDAGSSDNVLIFDAKTSLPIEIDLRGSLASVLERLPVLQQQGQTPDEAFPSPRERAPGRPKLGVTAREVTLLPRHWEWLAKQPGGASVALRKLVEQARRTNKKADELRQAREAAYRFMHAMAGNNPGYEEATRALFASDCERLRQLIENWPSDVRNHILFLTTSIMEEEAHAENAS